MTAEDIDEAAIHDLSDSLGLDLGGWSQLRDYVLLNRYVRRQLTVIDDAFTTLGPRIAASVNADSFLPLLEESGFTEDGAWERLDDIDSLAGVQETHDLIQRVLEHLDRLSR
jgi:hypothetical protein